jgi:hypothetical protein
LSGDTVLEPGEEGEAFVLAATGTPIDPATATAETVRARFIRYGTNQPEAPSHEELLGLLALSDHKSHLVRQAVVESWQPWLWRSSLGPLPGTAPVPLPAGELSKWARDSNKGVRRRTARLIKELRPSRLAGEAEIVLGKLLMDPVRGIRRASYASLKLAPAGDVLPVEEAWSRALKGVTQQGPPGRASANTLAYLAQETGPTAVIDPRVAVQTTLRHHPDRAWHVWTAWRREVPFDGPSADALFRRTVGYAPRLVRFWAETDPTGLSETLRRWEPRAPHSERFELIARWLADTEHAGLREVLDLPPED